MNVDEGVPVWVTKQTIAITRVTKPNSMATIMNKASLSPVNTLENDCAVERWHKQQKVSAA